MVAIVHNSKSLRNALHYNENKVRQGVAKFIHSANYSKDTELLGFNDKIKLLEKLTALNQQTKVNSVHVSLNFDTADKLNEELLKEIAGVYMNQIGFGEQPYLVYQHYDAGHPHIHIVTTNIKRDGRRMELHNLARNQSMKASKQIEKEFNLIQATSKHRLGYELKPVNVQRVQYGKAETKRAITNVLDHVPSTYKYASLAELNAVLQQYNVIADRGSENSRIYQSKGLVYRILDANKQKIGVPIKASLIFSKPTLKNIEARFESNEREKQGYKLRVMNAIDFAVLKKPNQSLSDLIKAVQKENIHVVLRQNNNGVIYGITYVDHHTKCVFNGSHLGKQYSANGIQQRCNTDQASIKPMHELKEFFQVDKSEQTLEQSQRPFAHFDNKENFESSTLGKAASNLFDEILQPEENQNVNEPFEQKKFKRKRKRKQQHWHN
jgi:hypothetical protein